MADSHGARVAQEIESAKAQNDVFNTPKQFAERIIKSRIDRTHAFYHEEPDKQDAVLETLAAHKKQPDIMSIHSIALFYLDENGQEVYEEGVATGSEKSGQRKDFLFDMRKSVAGQRRCKFCEDTFARPTFAHAKSECPVRGLPVLSKAAAALPGTQRRSAVVAEDGPHEDGPVRHPSGRVSKAAREAAAGSAPGGRKRGAGKGKGKGRAPASTSVRGGKGGGKAAAGRGRKRKRKDSEDEISYPEEAQQEIRSQGPCRRQRGLRGRA
jgi:hypothetical protein